MELLPKRKNDNGVDKSQPIKLPLFILIKAYYRALKIINLDIYTYIYSIHSLLKYHFEITRQIIYLERQPVIISSHND